MNIFEHAGKKAIGSRLRLLTEKVTTDAAAIYRLYNVELTPKWFPVFYVLTELGPASITEIAKEISHSHVSVGKIVREMAKAKLVTEKTDRKDGRRTVVQLTPKGRSAARKIEVQYRDVQVAVEEISKQATHDLWQAVGEWDELLDQRSLLDRVTDAKRKREGNAIEIIDFAPSHAADFKSLNERWIRKYFKMEAADYAALDHPQSYIIDKGGCILMAVCNGRAIGTCALIRMKDEASLELAKMAISPKMQGQGIGLILVKAAIARARKLGAKRLYLESNTILKSAIHLYEKVGFRKITGAPSPYERSNIQMELLL